MSDCVTRGIQRGDEAGQGRAPEFCGGIEEIRAPVFGEPIRVAIFDKFRDSRRPERLDHPFTDGAVIVVHSIAAERGPCGVERQFSQTFRIVGVQDLGDVKLVPCRVVLLESSKDIGEIFIAGPAWRSGLTTAASGLGLPCGWSISSRPGRPIARDLQESPLGQGPEPHVLIVQAVFLHAFDCAEQFILRKGEEKPSG